jgi:hypothetical protein
MSAPSPLTNGQNEVNAGVARDFASIIAAISRTAEVDYRFN